MDDDVIVIDEIEEEPEQITAQNYEYMLAQTLLTREAIQEKLKDPSENSNFQFVGSSSHNNSIWNNFLAITYGGVEQNFFKCRDCNEIFDKDPQKSLGQLRSHSCKTRVKVEKNYREYDEDYGSTSSASVTTKNREIKKEIKKEGTPTRVWTREQLAQLFHDPVEKKHLVAKQKTHFKCFAWQFMDVVFYKNIKQPYARCRYCEVLVPYTNKNGTTSIRKHALRCPDILRIKRNLGKQGTKGLVLQNSSFDSKDIADVSEESSEMDASLVPAIEIYSDEEKVEQKPSPKMARRKFNILTLPQLKSLYEANKDSKDFIFSKSKSKAVKNSIWIWLETVYYKDMRQDCYRCIICDNLVNGSEESELVEHIASHDSKIDNNKKPTQIKKEKGHETTTDTKSKSNHKRQSLPAAKPEPMEYVEEAEEILETFADATNFVAHNLVDCVVTSTGQSLSFLEDPNFRLFAQSLINLGAKHGERNANDFLPTIDSVLKQSIPQRVRGLKGEIKELIANESHLSISVDLIKDSTPQSKSISYFTVKVHAITECFTSKVYVLGIHEFLTEVSHEAVHQKFIEIMKEYVKTDALLEQCTLVLNENNEILVKAFEKYTRLPSVTHSLELIVNEVLQVEDPELNISRLVVKIQELFDHITKDHNYTLIKGECLLDLLEEFYEMNKPIEKLLKYTRPCQRDHSVLSDIPKNTIKTVLNSFEVIKLCVDTIRQNQITINGILLWKKKLIEQYSPVLFEHILPARLKFHTLELIQSKFLIDNPIYKIALFLNPNFKNLKFLSETERQEVFTSIRDMFIKKFRNSKDDTSVHDSEVIDKEINKYFVTKSFDTSSEDVLEFWKRTTTFPNLKTIARHVLSIPGTSDGVGEEVFQKANRSLANGIGTSADFLSIIFLNSNYVEV